MSRKFITRISAEDFKKRMIKSGKFSCNFKGNRFTAYYSTPLPNGFRKCFDGKLITSESGETIVQGQFRYFKSVLIFLLAYNVFLISFTALILYSFLSKGQSLPWELWFLVLFPLVELALFLVGTHLSKKNEELLIEYFIENLHCTEVTSEEQTHA